MPSIYHGISHKVGVRILILTKNTYSLILMILAAGKGFHSVYPNCRVHEAVHLGGFIVVKSADSSQVA